MDRHALDYEGLYNFDQSHPQGGRHGSSIKPILYITLRVMMVSFIYN